MNVIVTYYKGNISWKINLPFYYKENHYRNICLKVEMILDLWKGQHNGVTGIGQALTQLLKRHQNDKCSHKTYIASRKGHPIPYQVGH